MRLYLVFGALFLAVLTGIAYHSAPKNDFHFDDLPNVRENAATRMEKLNFGNLKKAALESPLKNRPISYLTFALDWWRGKGKASTFQWTNMVVHWIISVFVFYLILTVLSNETRESDYRSVFAALTGAALWAVHPIQVQAVTYIVQRMAQLATLFTVMAVVFFLLGRASNRRSKAYVMFGLCGFCALVGAFSKENAWIVPVLLILAELCIVRNNRPLFRNNIEKNGLRILVSSAAVIFIATLLGIGPLAGYFSFGYSLRNFTMIERVLTQPQVILFHMSQILWPFPDRFSLEHDFAVSSSLFSPPVTLVAILTVLAWCSLGCMLLLKKGRRVVGFFVLWIPVTLLIESTLAPLEMVFEHRMYMPLIGIVGLVSLLIYTVQRRASRPLLTYGIPVLIIIGFLIVSTISLVPVWRTPLSLAKNSVRNAPNSARAWAGLGQVYLRDGPKEKAESALQRARELDPNNRWALEYYGVVLMDKGDLAGSYKLLKQALMMEPDGTSLLNHMGEIFLKWHDYKQAEYYFGKAIKGKPWVPSYRWNRALALERLERCNEARTEWNKYLELETVESERAAVREHLHEEYETEGGKCFPLKSDKF